MSLLDQAGECPWHALRALHLRAMGNQSQRGMTDAISHGGQVGMLISNQDPLLAQRTLVTVEYEAHFRPQPLKRKEENNSCLQVG